jgi:hypothetical protein
MDNKIRVRKLLKLFLELKKIMICERENNWIRGIDLIINSLRQSENADETIRYVSATYKSMSSGSNSFSDFFIWREDFDERVLANGELDKLKEDIWSLLDI